MQSRQAQVLPEHQRMRWVPAAHSASDLRLSLLQMDQLILGISSLGGKHCQLQAWEAFRDATNAQEEKKRKRKHLMDLTHVV